MFTLCIGAFIFSLILGGILLHEEKRNLPSKEEMKKIYDDIKTRLPGNQTHP